METPNVEVRAKNSGQTVVLEVLFLSANGEWRVARGELLNVPGRKMPALHPGASDVRTLAPGVYFVRIAQAQAVRKVVRPN